jgi:hypothetical protein
LLCLYLATVVPVVWLLSIRSEFSSPLAGALYLSLGGASDLPPTMVRRLVALVIYLSGLAMRKTWRNRPILIFCEGITTFLTAIRASLEQRARDVFGIYCLFANLSILYY